MGLHHMFRHYLRFLRRLCYIVPLAVMTSAVYLYVYTSFHANVIHIQRSDVYPERTGAALSLILNRNLTIGLSIPPKPSERIPTVHLTTNEHAFKRRPVLNAPNVHLSTSPEDVAIAKLADFKETWRSTTKQPARIGANGQDISKWEAVLSRHASPEKLIVLALIDSAYLDVALNFHETSLARWNITNFLFVSSGAPACRQMALRGIQCHVYMSDSAEMISSVYGAKDFIRKMNIRTFMILDALNLGFDVLHTDVDIFFQKNPLDDIQCNGECDMAILWDSGHYNAGFLLIRAKDTTKHVYKHMDQTARNTTKDDQEALNLALRSVGTEVSMHILSLSTNKYQSGQLYFKKGNRIYAGDNPCDTCVVIHNNWITTREAKVYRFKEMHMWWYDGEEYYSRTDRKFITYTNPLSFNSSHDMNEMENRALVNAFVIGKLLNRTVILPRFHCTNDLVDFCPFTTRYRLRNVDRMFSNKYRESSFLSHHKVPAAVKNSVSKPIDIKTKHSTRVQVNDTFESFTPNHPGGATSVEIQSWFAARTEAVLYFYSLYSSYFPLVYEQNENKFLESAKRVIR